MSDPVSNAEIEDVLSSIRRLVSEDTSPLHRRKQIAEGAKERFVLTPALRVSEDEAEPAVEPVPGKRPSDRAASQDPSVSEGVSEPEAAEASVGQPAPRAAESLQDRFAESRQTLEQRIAELEAALQQSPEEWEPDGSEVTAAAAPDMPSIADLPDSLEEADGDHGELSDAEVAGAPEAQEIDWSDVEDAELVAADTPTTDANEAVADAVIGDDVADSGMEPEAEVLEAIVDAGQRHVDLENAAPVSEEPAETGETDAPHGSANRFAETPDDAAEDGPFDAAPEPGETAPASDTVKNVDHVETDDKVPSPDDEERFDLFEETAVLDEGALREMVSQLVRDELQGVLGERITRNVRRLVRREIQRAIAMRDLE